MLVESVGSALVVSKLQGGKISNLLKVTVNKWWLFLLSGLIEFTASYIRAKEIEGLWVWVDKNVLLLQVISYSLLIAGVFFNRKSKGFRLIFMGIMLNLIVIVVNGGRMPVNTSGFDPDIYNTSLEILGSGKDLTHRMMSDSTKLWLLGDIIHFRNPYPFPKSLSIGDIFMMVGVFLYTRQEMLKKN